MPQAFSDQLRTCAMSMLLLACACAKASLGMTCNETCIMTGANKLPYDRCRKVMVFGKFKNRTKTRKLYITMKRCSLHIYFVLFSFEYRIKNTLFYTKRSKDIVLLFYVHGTHLRSGCDGQLT